MPIDAQGTPRSQMSGARDPIGTIAYVEVVEIDTPHGPARAHVHAAKDLREALVLGHGAGGGVEAPDLVAACKAALSERFTVLLAEQPYRVAGRRSPPPASHLDAAWIAIVESLRAERLENLPVIVGGRSMGGRVAAARSRRPAPSRCCASRSRSSRPVASSRRAVCPSWMRSASRCWSYRASETRSGFHREARPERSSECPETTGSKPIQRP